MPRSKRITCFCCCGCIRPKAPPGRLPNPHRVSRAVRSILALQGADGGFSAYPKGPADVSASVKAYCALKLATHVPGISIDPEALTRCHQCILSLGGIQAANSYVKINLSLFGLYPREFAPSIPPELMLSGKMIYEMSSWTRAIVIPLSVLHAANPQKPVPAGFNLNELVKVGVPLEFKTDAKLFSWKKWFYLCDDFVKWWDRYHVNVIRQRAIGMARDWVLHRFEKSDGLAAIYPPMMYAIMMLDLLGYGPEHPARVEAQRQFDRLLVDDGDRFFHQPCFQRGLGYGDCGVRSGRSPGWRTRR